MSLKEHANLLDKIFKLDAGGFIIDVKVDDVKTAYGQTRVRVSPVYGEGLHWVSLDRLEGEGRMQK